MPKRKKSSKLERQTIARIGYSAYVGIKSKYGREAIEGASRGIAKTIKKGKVNFRKIHARRIAEAKHYVPEIEQEPERVRLTEKGHAKFHTDYWLRRDPKTGKAEWRTRGKKGDVTLRTTGWKEAHRWLGRSRYVRRVKRLAAQNEWTYRQAQDAIRFNREAGEKARRKYLKSAEFKKKSKDRQAKIRRKIKHSGERAVLAYLEIQGIIEDT